jgi:hypothetical protein
MKTKFEETSGTKLTFMPFFVRAAVEALRKYPTVNSSVDGTNIVLHKECNIGIAVALDWGLIVPVIKNAEEKNFLGIARAMNDLAERARAKKLKPDEVAEGTFAITNPGVFGGLFGLPVINQPNVAILGLGTIEKRPVVIDDAIDSLDGVSHAVLRSPRGGRSRSAPVYGAHKTHARELDRKHHVTLPPLLVSRKRRHLPIVWPLRVQRAGALFTYEFLSQTA